MNNIFRCLLVAGICCGVVGISQAQPPDPEPPVVEAVVAEAAPPATEMRRIKMQHIQPSMVSWWMRPQSNPEPSMISSSRRDYVNLGIGNKFVADRKWFGMPQEVKAQDEFIFLKKKAEDAVFVLGLESVFADDVRNEIIAFGTRESLDELEKVVAKLDQPFVQIEVGLYLISTSDKGAEALGVIQDENGKLIAEPQESEIFKSNLEKLQAEGNAKSIMTPRMSAINNLGGNLSSIQITPISDLSIQVANTNFQYEQIAGRPKKGNPLIVVSEAFSCFMGPSIGKDGQVSVLVEVAVPLSLGTYPGNGFDVPEIGAVEGQEAQTTQYGEEQNLVLERRPLISTVLQVPDNKIMFAGEFQFPLNSTISAQNKNPEFSHELCFVSARVVKHDIDPAIFAGP